MSESSGIKRVAIIGPECTGKSDLTQYLASYFQTVWVPEFARQYLDELGRQYNYDDLRLIAEGQLELEDKMATQANRVLFCDTNLYVIKVWSEFVFQKIEPQILEDIRTRVYDLYLLTYVDIPWEADPLREHPHKRDVLYDIYLGEMKKQDVLFLEIKGERNLRRQTAVDAVQKLLDGKR